MIMTTVTVVEDLSPVAFLPDNLPAVPSPVPTDVLYLLLGHGAVPVVLHLALDALHWDQFRLACFPSITLLCVRGDRLEEDKSDKCSLDKISWKLSQRKIDVTQAESNIAIYFVVHSYEKLTQLEIISFFIYGNVVDACLCKTTRIDLNGKMLFCSLIALK